MSQDVNGGQEIIGSALVAQLAYHIWIAKGEPEGHELEHWQEAESILKCAVAANRPPAADTSGPRRLHSQNRAGRPKSALKRSSRAAV